MSELTEYGLMYAAGFSAASLFVESVCFKRLTSCNGPRTQAAAQHAG